MELQDNHKWQISHSHVSASKHQKTDLEKEFLTDKSQNHEKRIHIIVKKMKVTLFVYPVVFSSKQEEIFSNPNLLQVGRKLQLLITAF